MLTAPRFAALALPCLAASVAACTFLTDDETASQGSEQNAALCSADAPAFRFEHGGDGHADPLGAGAAHQARAGKIRNARDISQPADARSKIRAGDFILANDHVAVYVEAEGISDGYLPFGGEILAIEPIGKNGRPTGVSYYGESAILFGLQTISPERVSVVADGSDGGPAIVRASGTLKTIPLLDAFSALFPERYDLPAAIDYVLEPGSSRVTMRLNVANTRQKSLDFTKKQLAGFFQSSRSQTFLEGFGFDRGQGDLGYVAWEAERSAFMVRPLLGPVQTALDISGLQIFTAPALKLDPCAKVSVDYLELTGATPGIDALLEAKRSALAEPAWREVRGVVREDGGGPLAGAVVHATAKSGYLTRAVANASGAFVIHVPPGAVSLTPTLKGWALPPASPLAADDTTVEITLPRRSTLDITAIDASTKRPLPVRVQIVPDSAAFHAPTAFGVKDEPDNRLYREYATSGHLTVPVPPGGHRVIVTRGYEYELYDAPIVAAAGETTKITAALTRSVDSSGVMCADFHIHSIYSADSSEPIEKKVKGAIADGLEIPISSEHEYVLDFDPTIQRLGLGAWAFGMGSEELTTFSYGHFGVVPMTPKPEAVNHGAFDWTGKNPPELFPLLQSLPERPLIIVNHPSDSALGYFAMAGFDRKTTTGTKGLWSDAFSAIEVFNASDFESNRDSSVADWFALLNGGKVRWATGSSDSHDTSTTPIGYPRTCLRFGHDDPRQLTPETVRDVMRAGTAVISGGLTMTVEGPDGVLPGGVSVAGDYKVVVASPGWLTASTVEVIVDGVTTQTITLEPSPGPGPGKRHELRIPIRPTQSRAKHWVVFHAAGAGDLAPLHPGRRPFAVSNPIFF